jgi:hypothetical protein
MFYESNNGNGKVPRTGFDLVKLVKAGIPAKAQKSEKATRNWFAKDYAKKLAPAAPPSRQCPPVGRTTGAIATQRATAEAIARAGNVRRGESEPIWQAPEQPRPRPVTAAEIVAAAAKRDKPTSGTPMGAAAKAIILAGQRRRNEV